MIQRIVNGGSCAGYCNNCCLQLTIFVHAASIVNPVKYMHMYVTANLLITAMMYYCTCMLPSLVTRGSRRGRVTRLHAAHFTCIALYFRFTMEEQAIVLDWAAYTIVGPLDRLESVLCHVTSHCSSDPTVTKMIEDSTLTSEAQVCVWCVISPSSASHSSECY